MAASILDEHRFIEEDSNPGVLVTLLTVMAITILQPTIGDESSDYGSPETSNPESSDESMVDAEDERPAKRARLTQSTSKIVTPGETITDDIQWMR